MMKLLEGKTALITGGGQGIGRGIADELAGAGAEIVVGHLPGAMHEDRALEAVNAIRDRGGKAMPITIDVTNPGIVKAALVEVRRLTSGIDVLVNNAGVMQMAAGLETRNDDFQRCYAVNLEAIWTMAQALLPDFIERGGGRIVNIASTAARRGQAESPAYCASKAAAVSLTQSLAVTLGPKGVTVNAVCPGLVETEMSDHFVTLVAKNEGERPDKDRFMEATRASFALRRHITAQDIGRAVLFFASDLARNITGQALNVDAGDMMN